MKRHLSGLILAVGLICAATGCNLVLNRGAAGNLPIEALAGTALKQSETAKLRNVTNTIESLPLPGETATLTLTATLTPSVTLTPTPQKVTVTVSKNTNCRTGPEKQFDLVGIMMVGETAEAIGRNAQKTYWVIRLPSNTAKTCWLWYEWATVSGNGDALPIVESPPTPTWSPRPDFTFNYVGLTSCGANRMFRLQVTNTGNVPWESFRVQSEDTVTSAITNFTSDTFLDFSGCGGAIAGSEALSPGDTNNAVGIVPGGSSGHNVVVALTLYTENLGSGTSKTGSFTVTVP